MEDTTVPGGKDDVMKRDPGDVPAETKAAVTRWCGRIKEAKNYEPIKKAFDRMVEDMTFARLGADKEWAASDFYIANIITRYINQSVASLYAKNPKAVAKRRPKLDYTLWDGSQDSLVQAAVALASGGPAAATAAPLVQEVTEARARNLMMDRMGKTLEYLFSYYLDEQEPRAKVSFKQLVRRAKVCSVGYVKLGFQRAMEKNDDISAQMNDVMAQIKHAEMLAADAADDKVDPGGADLEELKATLETLQSQEMVVAKEGLTFSFPKSTTIIMDPRTKQLKGWVGTRWIAEEADMTVDDIKSIYNVDISSGFTPYQADGEAFEGAGDSEDNAKVRYARVWKVQDKATGTYFVLADGYCDYLKAPAAPPVWLERFFNIFALTFNDIEDEKEIIPPSDVHLLKHPQNDINRSRQSLREHRERNTPGWVVAKGRLDEEDKKHLRSNDVNVLVELNSLNPGEKVADLIQPKPTAPIDPSMYDTNPAFEDVLRTVGAQEANLGGVAGGTATESSIAEGSRVSSLSSNVDDLDELLTEIARGASQIMLMEMSPETVKKIVGPGAVWPDMNREQAAAELWLEVKAGSSGRPNKAAELANFERAMPFLVQLPGLNPMTLSKAYLELLELDIDDAIVEGAMSIVAQNQIAGSAQPGTGDPATDPAAQGAQGGANSPQPGGTDPGPQPEYPAAAGMPMN